MLTAKVRLSGPEGTDPEDYLSASLGVIFPDDIANQHGDLHHHVIYQSPTYGDIHLELADPQGEDNRRLFSHFLWNSGLQLAEFIEEGGDWSVKDKKVLELGAGTGLSGIVAAKAGALNVVITDYPAPEVLANIKTNVARNLPEAMRIEDLKGEVCCRVHGHEWGKLEGDEDAFVRDQRSTFGIMLVADCLWMPWQHRNLMKSIGWFLSEEGKAWVIAGFHTGRAKVAGFFDEILLEEEGLEVERIWERNADGLERVWLTDRGIVDVTESKRWLVVAILRRRRSS